ncbi:GNAT family protein [Fulvivirga kasyanovii]|uniref:N-acetyltransferase n=1 Tax=Fulvivirga kasyanovii TaxID=396812 RepID=A0ABW9RIQ1_9BACT|nr:GNAT family protein [Fulvivirga kasyanovii]MTI23919.1 N-acetyltransferase [Fulvivirga kasyanovii]
MIKLVPFGPEDFTRLISWIDSKKLLITIAGDFFTFPLTVDQLRNYLEEENSYAFNIADNDTIMGHAEIILSAEGTYKIDKLIIGEASNRGKGIGQQVINRLLNYCFTILNAEVVELNVFGWNIGGIRCYEKCGFTLNRNKKTTFAYDTEKWTALNMTINKDEWLNRESLKYETK